MDHYQGLIKELNRIIGSQGRMESNLSAIPAGEYVVAGEDYFFAIDSNYGLLYPKQKIPMQTAHLIRLLFRQWGNKPKQARESERLLRMVLEGEADFDLEEINGSGINTEKGHLPLVIFAREFTRSLQELFYSYFSDQVIGVYMEGFYHVLIPIEHLSLEAKSMLDLEDLGRGFAELLEEEGLESIFVALVKPVYSHMDWSQAFTTAKITIGAGRKFYPKTPVYFSWKMSLENMLSSLPQNEVEKYVVGVLGTEWKNKFDPEVYRTTRVLLQENFNISETSRKLFIHRNTLLYRLDKVKEETGKDLRVSMDAVEVYLALLLLKKDQ